MSKSEFFSLFVREKTYLSKISARKRNKFVFCFPQKQFYFLSLFVLVEISVCRFSFFSKIYEELSERKSWKKFKFSRYQKVGLFSKNGQFVTDFSTRNCTNLSFLLWRLTEGANCIWRICERFSVGRQKGSHVNPTMCILFDPANADSLCWTKFPPGRAFNC